MTTHRTATRLTVGFFMVAATACGGDKPATNTADSSDSATSMTPPGDPAGTPTTVATVGETEFQRCVTCHMANGEGMAGAFPPLAGSEYVNGSADRMIAIIIHGLQGPITVKGVAYNSAMLPYGTSVPMSDEEIAAVSTYVRSNWGNTGAPVSAADVARVREATKARNTPWTVEEVNAFAQ